jgi:hypothetical protein
MERDSGAGRRRISAGPRCRKSEAELPRDTEKPAIGTVNEIQFARRLLLLLPPPQLRASARDFPQNEPETFHTERSPRIGESRQPARPTSLANDLVGFGTR